jgi:outer membrane protein
MNSFQKILNIIFATAILGLLGFIIWDKRKQEPKKPDVSTSASTANQGKMAYFMVDSLTENFTAYKEAEADLKNLQSSAEAEINNLQEQIRQAQTNMPNLNDPNIPNDVKQDAVNQYQKKEANIKERIIGIQKQLEDRSQEYTKKVRKQIEDYLKLFNADKKYDYIIEYVPGGFIYLKSEAHNITNELIDGLNKLNGKK